jgi:cyclic pyranopterin phosphate synthase
MANRLIDAYGRTIDYLRLSVTDRCDLRCSYCLPQDGCDYAEPSHWLDFDELERLVRAFAGLGVSRVRLTGGEPLLRRNLPDLAQRLATIDGIEELTLSTNGTRLARQAVALRQAGITRINLSLDTLDAERMQRISGRDVLNPVLEGIDAAQAAGFPLRINMVVLPGVNEDEIWRMAEFCRSRRLVLRLIETMPMGDTGRASGTLDLQPIRARLEQEFGLVPALLPGGGPARYLQAADQSWSIGFITPLSQHFCDTCNRVRLSVDGALHLCLGQEDRVDLRGLLRSGASERELRQAILDAIARKPERHEFKETPQKLVRFMSATGG